MKIPSFQINLYIFTQLPHVMLPSNCAQVQHIEAQDLQTKIMFLAYFFYKCKICAVMLSDVTKSSGSGYSKAQTVLSENASSFRSASSQSQVALPTPTSSSQLEQKRCL